MEVLKYLATGQQQEVFSFVVERKLVNSVFTQMLRQHVATRFFLLTVLRSIARLLTKIQYLGQLIKKKKEQYEARRFNDMIGNEIIKVLYF